MVSTSIDPTDIRHSGDGIYPAPTLLRGGGECLFCK
jgi:hypothetical protein